MGAKENSNIFLKLRMMTFWKGTASPHSYSYNRYAIVWFSFAHWLKLKTSIFTIPQTSFIMKITIKTLQQKVFQVSNSERRRRTWLLIIYHRSTRKDQKLWEIWRRKYNTPKVMLWRTRSSSTLVSSKCNSFARCQATNCTTLKAKFCLIAKA